MKHLKLIILILGSVIFQKVSIAQLSKIEMQDSACNLFNNERYLEYVSYIKTFPAEKKLINTYSGLAFELQSEKETTKHKIKLYYNKAKKYYKSALKEGSDSFYPNYFIANDNLAKGKNIDARKLFEKAFKDTIVCKQFECDSACYNLSIALTYLPENPNKALKYFNKGKIGLIRNPYYLNQWIYTNLLVKQKIDSDFYNEIMSFAEHMVFDDIEQEALFMAYLLVIEYCVELSNENWHKAFRNNIKGVGLLDFIPDKYWDGYPQSVSKELFYNPYYLYFNYDIGTIDRKTYKKGLKKQKDTFSLILKNLITH
ncbi:hypothetical protein FRY74_06160 [Vicingus serpentipes]|uniref:Tetratricopeptide repeat protein n=1 Tax=Vicingus serpentipes TaxID=1926625 RepID=A0A5C6RVB8_9FLAO|nr:hypothetical protein [Vicingus serpentipes]TXB66153.1 hypothetical protein FRY74_06160 [Vicingus serpentipes]